MHSYRYSAKKMGDKNTWAMAEPNAGLYRTLSLAASALAKRQRRPFAGQPFVSRNSFRGTQTVTAFASVLMLLKPDCVDILESVKWIASCLKCGKS